MDWLQQGLLAVAIGLPAMVGLVLVITASRLTRLRLRRSAVAMVARDEMPAGVRATLDKAQPLLAGLGFQYRYSTATDNSVVTDGDLPLMSDVYEHPEGRSHAFVTPSSTPEQGEACAITWATLLPGGRVLGTVNCHAHYMISAPPGWTLHDDYLPDPAAAWQAHRERLAAVDEPIVTDGPEFFRVNRLASELLMAHCEKQGLLVRRGEHWQMPWRFALAFAWRLFLGQRRAGKVRARAAKARGAAQAQPGAGVQDNLQADIGAFQRQLDIQRSARWSAQKKFKVFLLTAALFLGVGSLWITWTFLPILLVVIGLHEGGHYLAMKLSGYRNLSIFFVPGLGGLAMGEKAAASPWEKLFVYLAGPVPGIALAVAGLVGQYTGAFMPPAWFHEFLIACLVINYLNLLPITPLDGGRVVETFLFARLPVARFLFAALGLAAFVAFGLWSGDKVLLVIAVFVALSLPHQWRVMRVDRAVVRHGRETLDERGAIERVFAALQRPQFARWPFAARAGAATALLPELQGRRAGAVEAAAAMAIYLACLLAPPVVAVLAVPQFSALGSAFLAGLDTVPDDVDPEPAQAASRPARDWYAEAAQAQALPESQRLAVLLGAAGQAYDQGDQEKHQAFVGAAWEIARQRPPQDHERARTLMAMARGDAEAALRRRHYAQVAGELAGLQDKPSLLLLAEAKEQLAWDADTPGAERVALLGDVVAHREQALPPEHHELQSARGALAQALDAEDAGAEAEALLRRNVDVLVLPAPTDRSRGALDRRTDRVLAQAELAWFLNARGRPREAAALMDDALALVPAKVSTSWEHPNRQASEARLWARLLAADAAGARDSWAHYERSRQQPTRTRGPVLLHELDRFVVARSTADEALKAQAQSAIGDAMRSAQGKHLQPRLCSAQPDGPPWRALQRQARAEAAKLAGVCGGV